MPNDSHDKQDSSKNSLKKPWPFQKTFAISAAACALLGIIGYEIVRENKSSEESPIITSKNFFFPHEKVLDEAVISDLNEKLNKVKEFKKLLFMQKRAPESTQISQAGKKLQEKDEELESLNKQLEDEKQKTATLDITVTALTDLIEIQRAGKERFYQTLQSEKQKVREELENEKEELAADFQKRLAELDNEKEALILNYQEKISELESEVNKREKHKEDLKEFYDVKAEALRANESAWKDYALDLHEELKALRDSLLSHEQSKSESDQHIGLLSKQIEEMEQRISQKEQEENFLQNHINMLAHAHNALNDALQIERTLHSYHKALQNGQYSSELDALHDKLQIVNDDLDNAYLKIAEDDGVREHLLHEANSQSSKALQLETKLSNARQKTAGLKKQYQASLDLVGEKGAELEDSRLFHGIQLAYIGGSYEKLHEQTLAEHEAEITSLKQKLEDQRSQENALQEKVHNLQSELESRETAHKRTIDENGEQIKLSQNEIEAIAQKNEQLMSILQETQNELAHEKSLREEMELHLQTQIANLETIYKQTVTDEHKKRDHFERELEAAFQKKEELEALLHETKDNHTRELIAYQEKIDRIQAELDEYLAQNNAEELLFDKAAAFTQASTLAEELGSLKEAKQSQTEFYQENLAHLQNQYDQLNDELAQLNQKLNDSQARIYSLDEALSEKDAELKSLQSRNEMEKQQWEQEQRAIHEEALADRKTQESELKDYALKLEAIVAEREAAIEELRRESSLKKEEFSKEALQLKEALEQELEKRSILENELAIHEKELENAIQRYETFKLNLAEKDENQNSLKEALDHAIEQRSILENELSRQEKEHEDAVKNIQALKQALAEKEESHSSLKETLDQSIEERSILENELSRHESTIKDAEALKKALAERDENQNLLKEALDRAIEQRSILENEIARQEKEHEDAIKNIEALKQSLAEKEESHSSLKESLDKVLEQRSILENELSEQEKEHEDAVKNIEALKQSLAEREENQSALKEELAYTLEQRTNLENALNRQESTTRDLETLRQELQEREEKYNALKELIAEKERQLADQVENYELERSLWEQQRKKYEEEKALKDKSAEELKAMRSREGEIVDYVLKLAGDLVEREEELEKLQTHDQDEL